MSQTTIWKINDLELELDLEDAMVLKRYEDAFEILGKKEKELIKIGKASEITLEYCKMFYDLFDFIFGEGTGQKIFNGKYNSRICEETYDSFIEFANNQVKERVKRFNKYKPKGR